MPKRAASELHEEEGIWNVSASEALVVSTYADFLYVEIRQLNSGDAKESG